MKHSLLIPEPAGAPKALAQAIIDGQCLVIPGAYDAFSAKLIEEAGFGAVYVGSYATAAAAYGLPDVGCLTLDQIVNHARKVASAVSVPVIADAEGGFFEPGNIWRTVREFEKAGVAAIHIEDHAGGKHTDLPQRLIPLDTMLAKLRAALDARTSSDFVVMARTDAIWATQDEEEAIRRVKAFYDIGIKYIFANGATPGTLRRMRKVVPAKYVTINLSDVRDRSVWDGAADIVLDYGFCLQAVAKCLTSALSAYRASSSADSTDLFLEPADKFEARLGYDAFALRSNQYTLHR
ncbi:isocitrate lyase/PEP mutase family protein [Paraburkholderia hospita]|uniref:isocitrate lyase/PEP mutase family protein n=1 Tax=Paraburkholderia hospita TaxID=169430 RepID=UPI000B346627|nr:isocitrate lyase/PEP mutase family protein [Paraburkholderia hospita]OUL78168.1 2-methylisocitrate lyase [Paraburkholderia hospita]